MKPDLDAIRKRCEAARAGPWRLVLSRCGCFCHYAFMDDANGNLVAISEECDGDRIGGSADVIDIGRDDATFIAHARTDVPALLDYIAELENKLSIIASALPCSLDDILGEDA